MQKPYGRREKKRGNEGRKPSFRFKVEPHVIEFEDLICGMMKFEGKAIGDFIIFRSNGMPAYNFAVIIDDHLMGITHVIRGENHLSNKALQLTHPRRVHGQSSRPGIGQNLFDTGERCRIKKTGNCNFVKNL